MDNYNKMDNTYYEEPIPSPDKLVDNPYEEILDKQPPIPPRGGSARHGFSNTGPPRPRAENKYEDVPLPTSRPTTNGNAPVQNGTSARLPMWRKPSLKNQKSSTPGPTCCQLVWWQWLIVVIYTVVSIAVIVLFILRFTRKAPQEEGMTAKLTSQGSTGMQVPEGSPVGPPGPPGVLGPPGLFGATGSTGPPGFNGAPGMSSTGQNGATGYPGRVGATGLRGRPGSPGFPGARGSPGFPGGAGAAGFPGAPGRTGATGAAGADSSPGATGSSGLPGSPGRPGSTHLNDECEQSNGGCTQICVDMYDGYYCACRKEYQLVRPTQTTCNPGNNMKCRTTLHGRMCWCDVTKTLLNGTRCTLRTDLCASRCEQKCISGPPVTCACQSGFTLNPDKETCSDVNECTTGSPCSSNAICINSYGSHYCLQP